MSGHTPWAQVPKKFERDWRKRVVWIPKPGDPGRAWGQFHSLPSRQLLLPATIVDNPGDQLEGPIEVGEVYAWEPTRPFARCYVVVTKVEHDIIWSYDLEAGYFTATDLYWNPVERFREACYRTLFKPMRTTPVFGA